MRIKARRFHAGSCWCEPRAAKALPSLQPVKTLRFGRYALVTPASLARLPTPPLRTVPLSIPRPEYADSGFPRRLDTPLLRTLEELDAMRTACHLARDMLSYAHTLIAPRVTTNRIDAALHDAILERGAYPSPLNYLHYPKSICTSVNNVIAHGIPDDRPLQDGDIVNIDITVYYHGFHGDTSATFLVGQVDPKGQALVECTRRALELGISECGPGVPFRRIGQVIEEFAEKEGYTVSKGFCGHGIGRYFHEPPNVYHFKNDHEGIMKPGNTFTIEPMLCQGTSEAILWPDRWTAVTMDGGRSAQFGTCPLGTPSDLVDVGHVEHTIAITDDGLEVLTR